MSRKSLPTSPYVHNTHPRSQSPVVNECGTDRRSLTVKKKPRVRDLPKVEGEVDNQALRRELAALFRHLIDKREMIVAQKDKFSVSETQFVRGA